MSQTRRDEIIHEIEFGHLHTGASLLWNRMSEIPPRYWALGGILGWVEVVTADRFFYLWSVLAVANLVDWIAGRWAVRHTEPEKFSRKVSRVGIYSKALGLIALALLRTMEAVLPDILQTPSTGGYIAAVVGLALFVDELDSIDHHRQRLGTRPIPMLSWAIGQLRDLTGAQRRQSPREDSSSEEEESTHTGEG